VAPERRRDVDPSPHSRFNPALDRGGNVGTTTRAVTASARRSIVRVRGVHCGLTPQRRTTHGQVVSGM
jgi:hypothetical protein